MLPNLTRVIWRPHARHRLIQRGGCRKTDAVWRTASFWGRAGRFYAWRVRVETTDLVLLTMIQQRQWVVVSVWPLAWWEARVATWNAAS